MDKKEVCWVRAGKDITDLFVGLTILIILFSFTWLFAKLTFNSFLKYENIILCTILFIMISMAHIPNIRAHIPNIRVYP